MKKVNAGNPRKLVLKLLYTTEIIVITFPLFLFFPRNIPVAL